MKILNSRLLISQWLVFFMSFTICYYLTLQAAAADEPSGSHIELNEGSGADMEDINELVNDVLGDDAMESAFKDYSSDGRSKKNPTSSMKLETAGGHKRNLLASDSQIVDSPFLSMQFSFLSSGPSDGNNSVYFRGSMENTRYLQLNNGEDAYNVALETIWKHLVTESTRFGLKVGGYYIRYFEDDDEEEEEKHGKKWHKEIPGLTQNGVEINPFLEYLSHIDVIWQIGLYYRANTYQDTDDSYDRKGMSGEVEQISGSDSRLKGRLQYEEDRYRDETLKTKEGTELPNTKLQIKTYQVSIADTRNWQTKNTWKNHFELSWSRKKDNGPGYYNSDKMQIDETVSLKSKDWRFSLNLSLSNDVYTERIVGSTKHPEKVYISSRSGYLLVEHFSLNDSLSFAKIEQMDKSSNDESEAYKTSAASIGLNWMF